MPKLEAELLGGRLPSAILQGEFYGPGGPDRFDYGWTVVYLSFFVVPHLVALILLWRGRRMFWHYTLATGVLFALALGGFFIIPTSPPWMVTEAIPGAGFSKIGRVTKEVLDGINLPVRLFNQSENARGRMSEVRLEPNSIAAMPSIHFAVTALPAFVARGSGRILYAAALLYTGMMGIALVYLGEHYILDFVMGGLLAGAGWTIAGTWTGGGGNVQDRNSCHSTWEARRA